MKMLNKLNLNIRVTLYIVVCMLLILSTLGFVVYQTRKKDTIIMVKERMFSQINDLENILDLNLIERQNQLKTALKIAHDKFYSNGEIIVDTAKYEVKVKNQISKIVFKTKLNYWNINQNAVNENYAFVDEVKKITGAYTTVFQKFDSGFVRISTNIIDNQNQRAIYTYIPNSSVVAKTIYNNETYYGRAYVVNDWYITAYEPIMIGEQLVGMLFVGVKEKDLSFLKDIIQNTKYYESGFPFLIGKNGTFIIHPQLEGVDYSNSTFFNKIKSDTLGYDRFLWPETQDGKWFWNFYKYYKQYDCYIVVSIPEFEFLTKNLNRILLIVFVGIIIGTILFASVIRLIVSSLTKPLHHINLALKKLSKGNLDAIIENNRHDEIGEITKSLNQTIVGLRKTSDFAIEIGKSNFDFSFAPLSNEDTLGNALIEMRSSLKKAVEEENRRKTEDAKHNWSNKGLAKFGDILRSNNDNLEMLSNNIIANLVKYVDANQGAIYILNSEGTSDPYLQLTACYAWDKKKFFEEKQISLDQDLTGQCVLDKETILITDVPDSYISITSGLGKTNPKNILITPLKINDEIHGVIEIASLNLFEKYKIDFIEQIAQNVATTLSSVKTNNRTSALLKDSQELAHRLSQQEEEMRQNLEELHATQEDSNKQAAQLASFTDSVNHTLVRAEYDVTGKLIYANTKFVKRMGYSSANEIIGANISKFIHKKDNEWFFKIWSKLSKGGSHFEGDMKHVTKDERDFWSMATYTCVRNSYGNIEKILFLGIDITEQKKQTLDQQGQLEALNQSNIKVELLTNGKIISTNKKFLNCLGFKEIEMNEKTIFEFISVDDTCDFNNLWSKIITGNAKEGQFKFITKKGDEKWLQGTFSAVLDMYGDISKIIFIANDITKQKNIEMETIKQASQLQIQEEMLRNSQAELEKQHEEFKQETKNYIADIESVKIRNEKTLEGALDAIITINHNEHVELFNKAAEDLLGYKKDEIIGQHIKLILPPKYRNIKNGEVLKFLKSPRNKFMGTRTEVNITNKAGIDVPVLITVSEAKIGNQSTFTAFIQNISVELF